jgi:hypothetical protein
MSIITFAKSQNRKRFKKSNINWVYYEEHHILPKSLFPLWEERKSNKVLLTPKEHYSCHQLLAEIYGGKMIEAFWYMTHNKKNNNFISIDDYEKLRLNYSNYKSNKLKEEWKGPRKIGFQKSIQQYWKNDQNRIDRKKAVLLGYEKNNTRELLSKKQKIIQNKPEQLAFLSEHWKDRIRLGEDKSNGILRYFKKNNTPNEGWLPEKEWRNKYKIRISRIKPFICIETNEIFNCWQDAYDKYGKGKIKLVCDGKRKSACGFTWRWLTK